MPLFSFPEIIHKYARNPPLRVAISMKMGRPSLREHQTTTFFLSAAEEMSLEKGMTIRKIRETMREILDVWPENVSRSLTIDEMISLCDELGIDVARTVTLTRDKAQMALLEE